MSLSVAGAGRLPGFAPRVRFVVRGVWRALIVPVALLWSMGNVVTVLSENRHRVFFDFKGGLYEAGVSILHGHNPYRAAFLAHQAAIMRGGGIAVGETYHHVFSVPLYPAVANLAVVPLSALGFGLAAAVYTVLSVAAMFGALWLLDVRDWRCHALVLISWPFLYGVVLGAIGPFLVLGIAAAWRWRDRVLAPALAIAAVIAIKIFPWTLAVWLLITRRWRALALCVAAAVVLTFGAWALIGFHGLTAYPRMLSNATYIQEGRADGIATVLLVLGASSALAQTVATLAGVALLAVAWRTLARPDGDRRAFGLAIIACLVATPISWDHYMVLLFVPIALVSPRFSRLWTIPVLTPTVISLSWAIVPSLHGVSAASPNALHQSLCWLAAEALVVVALCTTEQQRSALAGALRARVA
jgi:hypothetical protein